MQPIRFGTVSTNRIVYNMLGAPSPTAPDDDGRPSRRCCDPGRAWHGLPDTDWGGPFVSRSGAITDVAGIEVGHTTDRERGSGCTVVLCRDGAVGGVDVRGSAPGTRETDLLRPTNHVSEVHAVVLSGGSAFGLESASGVVRFLAERDIGYRAGSVTVPIVPAAILFDIGIAKHGVHPQADDGYAACVNASDAVS